MTMRCTRKRSVDSNAASVDSECTCQASSITESAVGFVLLTILECVVRVVVLAKQLMYGVSRIGLSVNVMA